MPTSHYRYRADYRRRRGGWKRACVVLAAAGVAAGVVAMAADGRRNSASVPRRQIVESWQAGNYNEAYAASAAALEQKPLDFFLLTVNGFSAYQIAIAQISAADTQRFIDRSIWALRKAMLDKEGRRDSRVFYVLGKAYYYKGPAYMDLAAYYLEAARGADYPAGDIDEYLGLSYAGLKDYRRSVEAFSRALRPADGGAALAGSDIFLVTIARSYFELGEMPPAKAYLARALEVSRDYKTIVSARLLLGGILTAESDFSGAERQYLTIIDESGESAEARFFLGEIYALQDKGVKARAEWRKALRANPAYAPARERLNI